MALYQAKQIVARLQPPEPSGARDPAVFMTEFVIPAGLALNDVIEMNCLPKWAMLTRPPIWAFDDCDSNGTPLMAFDAGIMTGRYGDGAPTVARTVGTEFMAADTTCRQGGGVMTLRQGGMTLTPHPTDDRAIGLKVQAAAATLVVGARIRCSVEYIADPALMS